MQHRDMITIQKVISEMQIGIDMLGTTDLETFLTNEMLKRALGMTAINVGELVKVVTDELRNKYKEFPWKAVAGMRDITAVTEYFEKRDRIIDRKKIQNEKDTNYIACYVPVIRL